MAKKLVNIGSVADDGTGDPLRDAFDKINDNFNEVYGSLGDGYDLGLAIDSDGNIDINNDLTITGDLVVNGTTTTISSETVTFEDNILLINKADAADTPYNTTSAGIEIEKTGTNPSFIHTFSDSTWTLSDKLNVDGDVVADNLIVADSIIHEGDTDTNISFTDDKISTNVGGSKSLILLDNAIRLELPSSSDLGVIIDSRSDGGTLNIYDGSNNDAVRLTGDGDNFINSGDVGIGTSSPNQKLELSNPSFCFAQITATPTSSNAGLQIGGSSVNSIIQTTGTGGNLLINSSDNISLSTDLGTTQHFVLNSSGNVGIGTTSPSYRLTAYGSSPNSEIVASFGSANDQNEYTAIGLSGFIAANGATKAGLALKRTGTYGIGELHFLNNNVTDNSDITLSDSKMMIHSNGNVGIGTSSPGDRLVVNGSLRAGNNGYDSTPGGTAFSHTLAANSNTNRVVNFDGNGGNPSVWWSNANNRLGAIDGENEGLAFWTNSTGGSWNKNFYIKPGESIFTGNVGIGTTSPSSTLDVNGTIAFNSLKDSGEDITITKFVDEADTIASNNNDTTIPTSAAVIDYVDTEVAKAKTETANTSSTDRSNNYKIMGLAMDYLSRVHNDGGTVEGMEEVMRNTEELILG